MVFTLNNLNVIALKLIDSTDVTVEIMAHHFNTWKIYKSSAIKVNYIPKFPYLKKKIKYDPLITIRLPINYFPIPNSK